jgi:hypothetical protein
MPLRRRQSRGTSQAPAQSEGVLIASTSWWAFPSRLAMQFAAVGLPADAIAPLGHPLRRTKAVRKVHGYDPLRPVAALLAAIRQSRPSLVVPCDDRAVRHLHELYERRRHHDDGVAELVARSLGPPDQFALVQSRYDLIALARAEGVAAPEMLRIRQPEDVRPAIAHLGLPAMLKVDGTWGGLGVASIASVEEGERQFRARARPLQASRALKRLLVDRDAFHLLSWLERKAGEVTLQRFIHGRPANAALACWEGEIIAANYAEAAVTQAGFGASTVARMIDHPGMADTSVRLIRRLGLSGFCGLDFVIEQETGIAHLIEMNPRSTPLTHVALGPGRDLVAALAARAGGRAVPDTAAVTDNSLIAFFPQAWHQNPQSKLLQAAFHDVPWQDADLVRELIRPPWPDRGPLARLARRLRGSSSPTIALRQMVEHGLSNKLLLQPMQSDGKKVY